MVLQSVGFVISALVNMQSMFGGAELEANPTIVALRLDVPGLHMLP
jgi:hypothetical protein